MTSTHHPAFLHLSLTRLSTPAQSTPDRLAPMTVLGAIGRIEPDQQEHALVEARLRRVAADPSSVLVPAHGAFPARCMDGRPFTVAEAGPGASTGPLDSCVRTPRTAGATLTTWVVDLLLAALFRPDSSSTRTDDRTTRELALHDPGLLGEEMSSWSPAWLSLTCAALRAAALPVSGHTDDASHQTADCGCGAMDSLGSILALLGQRPAGIDDLVRSWGIDPDAVPGSARRRGASLSLTLPTGDEISGVISGYASTPLPVMHGSHHEVALVANTRVGTTVDTDALGAALSGDPSLPAQVFVIDVWSFASIADFLLEQAASTGAPVPATRDQIIATAAAFNAASALILCGPEMPVSVLV